MIEYQKLYWVDEIKDQFGNIIRDGTPLSAKNHNRMEDGIAAAIMGVNNNSEAIRESIPSGFTKLGDLDYSYMNINPNKIKTKGDSIAFVNGWKVTIPDGTIINLNQPPLSDKREDFVFLECWFDQSTSELKYRIRVVDDVNFEKAGEGLGIMGDWDKVAFNVTAQGGNSTPITPSTTVSDAYFYAYDQMKSWKGINFGDYGVYVAGWGTIGSKNILKTFDGYSYAIPMFRVWRRNSTAFSDVNQNGGSTLMNSVIKAGVGSTGIIDGNSYSDTLANLKNLKLNDILHWYNVNNPGAKYGTVTGGNNTIIITDITNIQSGRVGYKPLTNDYWNGAYWLIKDSVCRPDFLLSDIIDKSDIIDLRHEISLVGFNYDQLLQENFERALRGELQTNIYNRLSKTYHGIRKTPIDANTIFYCSFDGTTTPELSSSGISVSLPTSYNSPSPTGLGSKSNHSSGYPLISIPNTLIVPKTSSITIDFWVKPLILNKGIPIQVGYGDMSTFRTFWISDQYMLYWKYLKVGEFNHIRFTYNNNTDSGNLFINGISTHTYKPRWDNHPDITDLSKSLKIRLAADYNADIYTMGNYVLSDVSISNIDRGSTFATLPKDFIDGYARVMPAFNEQRWCYSDALTTEFKQEVIKSASPGTYPRHIKVTQASGNWAANDKITIKGLGGEIISGIIDIDTTIARITGNDPNDLTHSLYVDDISKIVVGDTLSFLNIDGSTSGTMTVTAMDIATKKLTTNSTFDSNLINTGWLYLVENTPSSSVPTVKAISPTTNQLEQKSGTWSGLGTNEATFTFGTNSNLTNQYIIVEYSLVETAGQGTFSDVLYQTLGGEINCKKLVKSDGPHIIDDFKGKVPGSIIENPNIAKRTPGSQGSVSLLEPSQFTEEFGLGGWAESIQKLDNTAFMLPCNISGSKPQQLFSFNVVEIIERKLGIIPIVDKVKWCRENISLITFKWYGYGSCPSGNKAYIAVRNYDMNGWGGILSHDSNTIKQIVLSNIYTSALLSPDGFLNFIAYTDSSDGITTSSIFTDYISLELTLKKPSAEYDVICPVNPRRDDGLGTIAFIRKETNELRFPFKAPINAITYGNYVVYQGAGILPQRDAYPLTDWKVIVSSIGTGGYDSQSNKWAKYYKGLYSLPLAQKDDLVKYNSLPIDILGKKTSLSRVGYHNTTYDIYPMFLYPKVSISDTYLGNPYYRGFWLDNFIGKNDTLDGVYGIHPDVPITGQYYLVAARLFKDAQGNIIMLISKSLGDTLKNDGGASAADTFYLNGRPIETI